jgi:hypothetical protein
MSRLAVSDEIINAQVPSMSTHGSYTKSRVLPNSTVTPQTFQPRFQGQGMITLKQCMIAVYEIG